MQMFDFCASLRISFSNIATTKSKEKLSFWISWGLRGAHDRREAPFDELTPRERERDGW